MTRCSRLAALLSLIYLAAGADEAPIRIGAVEFFGTAGLDVLAIRKALPVKEGDWLSWPDAERQQRLIKDTVLKVRGKPATDVTLVCCDERKDWILFVGLPGNSVRRMKHRRAPNGAARLPDDAVRLYEQAMDSVREAAQKGLTKEDHSRGYSLGEDPDLRDKQLAMRAYALEHVGLLIETLVQSRIAEHRRAAAHLLGYSEQSLQQITALVRACQDPDIIVRNNAVRALSVLAKSSSEVASSIPPEAFIRMLTSGSWTDRNKAGWLLDQLTERPDANLLRKIRSEAGESLREMTGWRNSYGIPYLRILGRVAGIEESKLKDLIAAGQVQTIVREFDERRK